MRRFPRFPRFTRFTMAANVTNDAKVYNGCKCYKG
jgi:hypothetical protein